MNTSTYSKLAANLRTMRRFPAWSDEVSEKYFTELYPVPDEVGLRMVQGVLRKFDECPSVRALLDWARELAPQRPFELPGPSHPALPSPGGHLRLTTTLDDSKPGLPEYGGALVAAAGGPPAAVREIMARLKERSASQPPEGRTEYGLQFWHPNTGRLSRTHATYSKAAADAAALDRNTRWPHQVTTVFHRDDVLLTEQEMQRADRRQRQADAPRRVVKVVRRRSAAAEGPAEAPVPDGAAV